MKVAWNHGVVDRAGLEGIANAFVAQLPGGTYSIAAHAGHDTIEIAFDGTLVLLTVVPCGKRVVRVQTTAFTSVWLEAHENALRSFECTPDPASEDAIAPVAIHLALPGFTLTHEGLDGRILRDGTSEVTVWSIPLIENFDAMTAARMMLVRMGFPETTTLGSPQSGGGGRSGLHALHQLSRVCH